MRQFYLLTGDKILIGNTIVSDKNKDTAPQIELLNGPVIPIGTVDASYTKSVYRAATNFFAQFELPSSIGIGTYSFIIVRKGAKFNERNKWTVSVYVKDNSMTTEKLVTEFVTQFTQYKDKLGMAVVPAGTTGLKFMANSGVDFEIKGADELMGIKPDEETFTNGLPAINDAAYIKDLADKAAADRGYEYTYQEANSYMYPNYSLNELKNLDPENKGFTVYTLKFAEKRETKTTDTAIKQIVQLAVPSDINLSTLESSLDELGFKEYTAQ